MKEVFTNKKLISKLSKKSEEERMDAWFIFLKTRTRGDAYMFILGESCVEGRREPARNLKEEDRY